MREAACRGSDPELWFPNQSPKAGRDAKAVCARCPVRSECLEYGLEEHYGIWGGKAYRERIVIRRERIRSGSTSTTTSLAQRRLARSLKGRCES